GFAVMNEATSLGYSINDRVGGHGVGRTMHDAPLVINHCTPGGGAELVAGQLLTVEPLLVPTTSELRVDERDGWTQRSVDGSRGAHAEHTLQVTDRAPIVLTERADDPSPRSSLG